jgi:hypothetical protein
LAGALADGVGAVPGSGAGFVVWLCALCCARCFSICGMLKKYCHASSTSPERMMARMVLRWSFIFQISSFISVVRGSRLRRLAIEATKRCAEILEHAGKIAGQGGTMAD